MDKYEYKVRSEEISNLIDKEKYTEAVALADSIDWRRVKSASMLLKIAALYRVNRRNEDSREILMLAYDRYPANRSVVYSLCELSIELDDVVAAIEYYKQFVKLAPKDIGVFTLRYRILEAQEASLEERIEILEELKKRDYQEEWAYELAYLYHRVGLSTKCVEECDDIILWFGSGSYVIKAMELKALHAPLTEVQLKNYNNMIEASANNYGSSFQDENYDGENYTGDYPNEEYLSEEYADDNYGSGEYAAEGYVDETYPDEGYAGEGYSTEGYANEGYSTEGYADDNYGGGEYATEEYTDDNYGSADYAEETYPDEGYANEGYSTEGYADNNYGEGEYATGGYADDNYGADYTGEAYGNVPSENELYTQDGYVDDGYGNLSYVQDANGYTSEFYVEQTFDENGNPVNTASYGSGYDGTDSGMGAYDGTYNDGNRDSGSYDDLGYNNENYSENANYNVTQFPKQDSAPPSSDAGDMSRYNTINLQKVVAESMKELFPDDDIFAEDREKYNPKDNHDSAGGDTRIYSGAAVEEAIAENKQDNIVGFADGQRKSNPDKQEGGTAKKAEKEENTVRPQSDTPEPESPEPEGLEASKTEPGTQTGRIAQMVTSVSEASPEPHTGAIKKVLIPGEDARLIKTDSNIDELRDTTERTVNEEHSRMEYNDENVYREKSLMELEEEAQIAADQATGSMNLDDVLVEWERMKQDNAKKHQEEIKKQILTQTGKILAKFDDSVNSGIFGELEREAEKPRKNAQADGADGLSRSQTSEDAFDVAYVSEKKGIVDMTAQASGDERAESGEYLAEPGATADDTSREEPDRTAAGAMTESTAQLNLSDNGLPADGYYEEGENPEYYEEDNYSGKAEAENPGYYEEESYSGEAEAENPEYYEEESYSGEAEAENPEYYEEESYSGEAEAENPGYYEEESYSGEAEAENLEYYEEGSYIEKTETKNPEYYAESDYSGEDEAENLEYYEEETESGDLGRGKNRQEKQYEERELDPEDAESIAEMAKEDALRTQEIKMNTEDLSLLSEKIVETTKKEATGARREEIREFTPEEQALFENFAVTKKIKKQIVFALDNITLAAYTGNIIITGDAGLDTVRMAKNLMKEYQASDVNFSGKLAKITGEKFNQRNIKDVFEKLDNGGIIIEKANGMTEEKLYEMAVNLNQENLGIVVIMEDTKKEITKLLEKQAMIADYFNIRIDLMEMDNNALVAYAKNYALALEYSIDELGTLALYTRIANMQSGNHVVTKDEVRDIIDEAIWKSKKSKIKNFVDVLFARRYDNEDMIVLKERDFM